MNPMDGGEQAAPQQDPGMRVMELMKQGMKKADAIKQVLMDIQGGDQEGDSEMEMSAEEVVPEGAMPEGAPQALPGAPMNKDAAMMMKIAAMRKGQANKAAPTPPASAPVQGY